MSSKLNLLKREFLKKVSKFMFSKPKRWTSLPVKSHLWCVLSHIFICDMKICDNLIIKICDNDFLLYFPHEFLMNFINIFKVVGWFWISSWRDDVFQVYVLSFPFRNCRLIMVFKNSVSSNFGGVQWKNSLKNKQKTREPRKKGTKSTHGYI